MVRIRDNDLAAVGGEAEEPGLDFVDPDLLVGRGLAVNFGIAEIKGFACGEDEERVVADAGGSGGFGVAFRRDDAGGVGGDISGRLNAKDREDFVAGQAIY
jgi:hypothetical protein